MGIAKKLSEESLFEIKHHLENTSMDFVKTYTLTQLSFLDGIDTRAVQKSGKYIPVRVDNGFTRGQYRIGRYKRPYSILWIRLDEIKYQFSKRNKGKQLVIE